MAGWRPRRAATIMAAAGVAVVVLVAGLVAWQLRATVRSELVQRDAEVLYSYLLLRQGGVETRLLLEPDLPLAGELIDVLLEASRLRGVLGVRLVEAGGDYLEALPATFVGPLRSESAALPGPSARLDQSARPADYLFGASDLPSPLLEVRLPLTVRGELEAFNGEAQFLLDASALAGHLADLDRQFIRTFLLLIATAATGLALLAWWSTRLLDRGAQALAHRQADLARANAELALAARTAAVGALSGHLVHGLKNPLAGLESFLALASESSLQPADWADATDAARRMRNLLNGVIEVLQTEAEFPEVDQSGAELLGTLRAWFGDHVAWPEPPAGRVPGRIAQFVSLVLTNLIQNAREAAPEATVELQLDSHTLPGSWRWTVRDRGPGLPVDVRRRLFLPVTSGKPGGSGLGLALAAQLARAADGELRLASTGPDGTVFELIHSVRP